MSLIIGYLLLVFPIIVLISVLLCIVLCLLLKQLHIPFNKKKTALVFAFFVVLLTILYATLGSVLHSGIHFESPSQCHFNLIPFSFLFANNPSSDIVWALKQFLLNVIMFVPFSFILPRLTEALDSFKRSLSIVLVFGIFIEAFQLFLGRIADIDDLLAYMIGGCIGFLLNKKISHRKSKSV